MRLPVAVRRARGRGRRSRDARTRRELTTGANYVLRYSRPDMTTCNACGPGYPTVKREGGALPLGRRGGQVPYPRGSVLAVCWVCRRRGGKCGRYNVADVI